VNKTDVGLSNVDNTSDATYSASIATLTNKTINGANNTLSVRLDADVINNLPVSRLNAGTGAANDTFWRGDGVWSRPTGTGDVLGPTGSVDGEVALYSGTTGKIIRRFSGVAGFGKFGTTGVFSTQAKIGPTDVDGTFISGQTNKDWWDYGDTFLLRDNVSGQLRSQSIEHLAVTAYPAGYISNGLTLANNVADTANDIDFRAGTCTDSTGSFTMSISSTLTKRLDAAWAAGNNQGGRDTGAIVDGSWHCFVITNPTTRVVDALFSQSLAPALPSGFTAYRRIGSIIRSGAGGIATFRQRGDYFEWTPQLAMATGAALSNNQSTALQAFTPNGVACLCDMECHMFCNSGGAFINISCPETGSPVFVLAAPGTSLWTAGQGQVWSSSSQQINVMVNNTVGAATFYISANGYWDYRDRT
jgi:hypothetical protein